MATEGWGRAKLIVLGEHSVVHGYPAIGVPLSPRTRVRLDPGLSPLTSTLSAELQPWLDKLAPLLCPPPAELPRGTLHIESDIPREGGYGSSAALSLALARAFCPDGSPELILSRAWQCEQIFHGRSSGLDIVLSAASGPLQVRPSGSGGLPTFHPHPLQSIWLVHASVPRRQDTKASVSRLGQWKAETDHPVHQWLRALGTLAESLTGNTDAPTLGRLAEEAQELLTRMGLADEFQDALLEEARRHGSPGGKLSGGGCGGAFFAVAQDQAHAQGLKALLETKARELAHHALTFRITDLSDPLAGYQ